MRSKLLLETKLLFHLIVALSKLKGSKEEGERFSFCSNSRQDEQTANIKINCIKLCIAKLLV
ncbi:MAG: hypothetical protein A2381_20435 [Bdellovibrionales bacterium RIFOXYB1_FULL_37_110]|nr:MAG: hypothetical protein A2181_04070 [Bdellovibrionales bacterium RIFOXYA1_FULL_38_20]OFZ51103.1 MAG: hypothetical protein A2417_20220 [Bdellovibrionales bacterium RIFOXYC1_FULL_37_79]OFZ60315.1 MAG: hypothetical protein A2381_20435 [Bdellovibrionales bacterium RIFOXYB1_FULL_37_110]OFZ63310.1 MAG: hypothetical protein A2577_01750 [Bdellovibrionales bacterium RIFOXYD1_FULL_36_51]